MVINSPCLTDKKELAIPGQTTTGKEFSNPLMAVFGNTAILKTVNSVSKIHAIVDGKVVVISESSVRSDLLFNDEDGVQSQATKKPLGGTPAKTRVRERVLKQPNESTVSEGPHIWKLRCMSCEKEGKDFEELSVYRENVKRETVDAAQLEMRGNKAKEKRVAITDLEDSSTTVRPIRSVTTLQPLLTIDSLDKGREESNLHIKERSQFCRTIATQRSLELLKWVHRSESNHFLDFVEESFDNLSKETKWLQIQSTERIDFVEILGLYERQANMRYKDFIPNGYGLVIIHSGKNNDSTVASKLGKKKEKHLTEKEQSDEEAAADYEHEKEELRLWLTVVSDEEETVDLNILSAKYPIVDWESQNLGSIDMEDLHVYKIIRADGNTSYHKSLSSILRKFDRQDLVDLHRSVMKRFEDTTPEGYNLLLWGDLKLWSSYITDGLYFDLLQHASREKVSSHQGNAAKDVELEARS
ncbi:hypothetical protein Tco_0633002 [Tanacetum coccineum]